MVISSSELSLESKRIKRLNTNTREWVWNTWKQFPPEWFVTLLWNDLPTSPVTSSSHSRHFINVLLCNLYGCNKCSSVPEFPHRLGITAFQERTETQGKVTFHTHLHLSNTNGHWDSREELGFYLRSTVGKKVQKLLKTTTYGNQGVTVKRWSPERHMTYNFKEMNRQRHLKLIQFVQDGDLLLDVERSDLLSIQDRMYGHKILFGRQNPTL
jgi:hypothetical protein